MPEHASAACAENWIGQRTLHNHRAPNKRFWSARATDESTRSKTPVRPLQASDRPEEAKNIRHDPRFPRSRDARAPCWYTAERGFVRSGASRDCRGVWNSRCRQQRKLCEVYNKARSHRTAYSGRSHWTAPAAFHNQRLCIMQRIFSRAAAAHGMRRWPWRFRPQSVG